MDGGKKGRSLKAAADRRSDRKSGTGMSGDPKKGGRGGKFTWEGADGYADDDLDLIISSSKTSNAARGINGGAATIVRPQFPTARPCPVRSVANEPLSSSSVVPV